MSHEPESDDRVSPEAEIAAETLPADLDQTLYTGPRDSESATDETLDALSPGARSLGAHSMDATVDAGSFDDPAFDAGRGGGELLLTAEAVGRYQGDRELGRGGIGRVYIAQDRHLKRQVAIKELLSGRAGSSPGLSGRAPSEQRFIREAWVTGQLQHPSIVPVYELGERADGTLYYTMKVVRGRTLQDAIETASTMAERLRLLGPLSAVAQAIAYAHSRAVIHRDLKPGNVMLGEFGETVVLDWGLAKVRGQADVRGDELVGVLEALKAGELAETVAGTPLGTPAYMSPEQAAGDLDAVDARSDVFSLGVMLFELVTGRLPFAAESALQLVLRVMAEPVPRIADVAPSAPADLAAIVDKACAHNPSDRYRDASELAADLESYLQGQRVSVYTYTSFELLRRFVRQNRALSAAVAIAFLISLIGATAVTILYQEADAERDRAQEALVEAERSNEIANRAKDEEAQQRLLADESALDARRGLARAYAERAEQLVGVRRLIEARAYAAAALIHSGANPQSVNALADLDAPEAVRERARLQSIWGASESRMERGDLVRDRDGDSIFQLRFSPDGRYLGYSDGTLTIWDVDAGRFVELETGAWAHQVAFAPTSQRVANVSVFGQLQEWDLEAGALTTRDVSFVGGALEQLYYAADGRRFYAATPWLVLIDVEAQTAVRTPTTLPRPVSIALSSDGQSLASVNHDGSATIYDPETLAVRAQWNAGPAPARGLTFVGNERIATAALAERVQLWDLDGNLIRSFYAGSQAERPSWSDDLGLVTGGSEVIHWDLETGRALERLPTAGTANQFSIVAPDGRHIAVAGSSVSGSLTSDIVLWRVNPEERQERFLRRDSEAIIELSLRDDPWAMAAVSNRPRGNVEIWERSGVAAPVLERLRDERVLDFQWLDSGSWIAIVRRGGERYALLGDRPERDVLLTASTLPQGGLYMARGAACDRRGRCVVVNANHQVLVHDALADQEIARFSTSLTFATSVELDDSGRWLAVGDLHGKVWVFDLVAGERVWRDVVHNGAVTGLWFTEDGLQLATSGQDGRAFLVDRETGAIATRFEGHEDWVNEIAVSGDRVVTVGDDLSVRMWNKEGELIQSFLSTTQVGAVVIDRDGLPIVPVENEPQHLVTTDAIWSQAPADLLHEAEARAGRPIDPLRSHDADEPPSPAPLTEVDSSGTLSKIRIGGRQVLSNAEVEVVDVVNGERIDGARLRLHGRDAQVDLPDGIDHFGIRITVGDHAVLLLGGGLKRGVHQWEGAWIDASMMRVAVQAMGHPPVPDGSVWIGGGVTWGTVEGGLDEPLRCAEVVTPGQAVVYAPGHERTGPEGTFITGGYAVGDTPVLEIRAGDAVGRTTLPPLRESETVFWAYHFPRSEFPERPTPIDGPCPTLP